MSKSRFPNVHKEVSRHGKIVWYYRHGHGPRARLTGAYGSKEFLASYRAALDRVPAIPAPKSESGTLAWLIGAYRGSLAWHRLASSTRRQRELVLAKVIESAGSVRASEITKQEIAAGRDRRASTPHAARTFLKVLRGLFQWACESGHLLGDPTDGIRAPAPKSDGFHSWTEDEVSAFEARWPIGTRERLALTLFLYTGFRRADVARLGRQHVKNGIITLHTGKTGAPVIIPILPELQAVIDATAVLGLTFIATHDGKPMVPQGFGNWFGDACRAAGVPGRAHGLRKAGCARAARNGATEAELRAIFGWSESSREPGRYSRAASREGLAKEAMTKLSKGGK